MRALDRATPPTPKSKWFNKTNTKSVGGSKEPASQPAGLDDWDYNYKLQGGRLIPSNVYTGGPTRIQHPSSSFPPREPRNARSHRFAIREITSNPEYQKILRS